MTLCILSIQRCWNLETRFVVVKPVVRAGWESAGQLVKDDVEHIELE
jgi:hypothetical protein